MDKGILLTPRFKRGLNHISYLTIANILSTFFSIILLLFLPNRLGVEQYGFYLTAASFVGLFNVLSFSGLTKIFLREGSRDIELLKKHLNALFRLKFFLAVFEILVILLVLFFIKKYDTSLKILILLFAINVLPNSLVSIPEAIIQSNERFKLFSTIKTIKSFFRTVGVVSLLFFSTNLYLLLVYLLILNLIFAIIFYWVMDKKIGILFPLKYIKGIIPRRYIKEALVFTLIGIAGTLTLKMDVAMLSWMATPNEVGIYGLAEKIVSKIASVRGIILTAFFPIFIKKYKDHKVNIGQLYKLSFIIFGGTLIFAGLLSISSKYFIPLVFKNEYSDSAIVFSSLIFYLVFYFANLPFSTALQSIGLEKVFLFHYLFTPFINIGLNYYLYQIFGVIGFAYSSIVVQVVILGFIVILGTKYIKDKGFAIKPA